MDVSANPIRPIKPAPLFGATIVEDGPGARSKYYKPLKTWKRSNGDSIEFFNVSIHDREQNNGRRIVNQNARIIPVSDRTKMVVASTLLVATIGLAAASFLCPPLAIAAFCCGVSSLAVFMSKGLVG